MFLIVFLILFRSGGLSYAATDSGRFAPQAFDSPASCKSVRLDGPGGPMEHVPVFDQAQGDNCYAHAAATLVSAERFSHAPPVGDRNFDDATSPLSTTLDDLLYRIRTGTSPSDRRASYQDVCKTKDAQGNCKEYLEEAGADVCDGVDAIRRSGSCSERQLAPFVQGNQFNVKTLNQLRADYLSATAEKRRQDHALAISELRSSVEQLVCDGDPTAGSIDVAKIDQGLPDAVEAPKTSNTIENQMNYLNQLIKPLCEPRIPISKKVSCNTVSDDDIPTVQSRIKRVDRALTARIPHPVGIAFCGTLLDPTSDLNYYGFSNYPDEKADCGDHAVVIIGRRWNPDAARCEYLVRNSWGTECGSYGPAAECEPGKGNFWIDRNALMRNTSALYTLEP